MHLRRVVALLLLAGLVGCGSAPTQPVLDDGDDQQLPDLDADLTGTFTGTFRSETDGFLLDAVLTLQLFEAENGEVTGGFFLSGVLSDDSFEYPIAGIGPLLGSVSPDQTASLQFFAAPEQCPHQSVEFTGAFDRRYASLVIGGPILILDACFVVLTFPSTIALGY